MGVGRVPVAPGTAGSLLGLALAVGLRSLPVWVYAAVVVGLFGLGVAAAGAVECQTGRHDDPMIVIDEVVGMAVAMGWTPSGWGYALLAFGLFRLLDIAKPFPIRPLECLPGGWGVMADDLAAGIGAHLGVQLCAWAVGA